MTVFLSIGHVHIHLYIYQMRCYLHTAFWINWYILCIILNPTLLFGKHLYEASKFYHLRKTFLILGMLIENKYNEKQTVN
jgi:hypothetical protein